MQILFQTSTEASCDGLGIIPCPVERFEDADKAVPHIGWNAADPLYSDIHSRSEYYYFVHSYCAKYNPSSYPEASKWVHSTTQYGQEIFISEVKKGNVFATQYHPEKSGGVGLEVLQSWLHSSDSGGLKDVPVQLSSPPSLSPKTTHALTRRIIACMDVRANDQGDLVVTKGDQYDVREKSEAVSTAGAVRNLGKPVSLAAQYYDAGADELCLLNIASFRQSPLQDQPMLAVVRAAAETVFVPLTIGGGIKDSVDPDGTKRTALEVAGVYFRAGADKVSIGSEAVYAVEKLLANNPGLDLTRKMEGKWKGDDSSAISSISRGYGAQAVVVSVDPRRVFVDKSTYDGPYKDEIVEGKGSDAGKSWWYQCTVSGGRESRPLSVTQLARGVEFLGAGELLVNSIDRDGTGRGFDLDLLTLIKGAVRIPVVASSGAGSAEHFVEVFQQTGVEAALAAGIFHRGEVKIADVKSQLRRHDISVRT